MSTGFLCFFIIFLIFFGSFNKQSCEALNFQALQDFEFFLYSLFFDKIAFHKPLIFRNPAFMRIFVDFIRPLGYNFLGKIILSLFKRKYNLSLKKQYHINII